MKIKIIFSLIILYILVVTLPSCNNASVPKEINPRLLFKQNCVLCHGADGKLQSNGAKDLSLSPLTMKERIHIINYGRKTMTPFKDILSPEEIEALAKYTLSFRK